jgi:hypothetical protein
MTPDIFHIGRKPQQIPADPKSPKRISNAGTPGSVLWLKDSEEEISPNDPFLEAGESQTITRDTRIIGSEDFRVIVEPAEPE